MWHKSKFVSHERILSASYQIHEAERMNILQIGEGITDDQEDSSLDADGKLMPLDCKENRHPALFVRDGKDGGIGDWHSGKGPGSSADKVSESTGETKLLCFSSKEQISLERASI